MITERAGQGRHGCERGGWMKRCVPSPRPSPRVREARETFAVPHPNPAPRLLRVLSPASGARETFCCPSPHPLPACAGRGRLNGARAQVVHSPLGWRSAPGRHNCLVGGFIASIKSQAVQLVRVGCARKGNCDSRADVVVVCRDLYGSVVLMCDGGLCAIACVRGRVESEP
jgi:hypothetical protein